VGVIDLPAERFLDDDRFDWDNGSSEFRRGRVAGAKLIVRTDHHRLAGAHVLLHELRALRGGRHWPVRFGVTDVFGRRSRHFDREGRHWKLRCVTRPGGILNRDDPTIAWGSR
jgi:hypothetical protein